MPGFQDSVALATLEQLSFYGINASGLNTFFDGALPRS